MRIIQLGRMSAKTKRDFAVQPVEFWARSLHAAKLWREGERPEKGSFEEHAHLCSDITIRHMGQRITSPLKYASHLLHCACNKDTEFVSKKKKKKSQ